MRCRSAGFVGGDERERARGCGNGCVPGRPFCAIAADGGAIFATGNLISRSKNRRMSCGRISLLKNVQVHRNRECYDGNRETLACDMTSEEKQAQEFNSLRNIPDSFKKIVIVDGTKKTWRNDEGFAIMGMKYFLLNADRNENGGCERRIDVHIPACFYTASFSSAASSCCFGWYSGTKSRMPSRMCSGSSSACLSSAWMRASKRS